MSLINIIKYNKTIYNIYFYVGSYVLKLLGRFINRNPKLIVFSSFGGRKYDDSPKCIFEEMIKDSRFEGYEFVWALARPDKFDIPSVAKKIRIDTFSYYKVLMAATVWVTNSSMERGLSFKPKTIFNVNTWHGTPVKLMGTDIKEGNSSFKTNSKENHIDILLAQGQYDVDVFSKAFQVPRERFRLIGLPRNDELVHCNTEENRKRLRKQLGIPANKKVILYAPTFREYEKDSRSNIILLPPMDLKKWERELGREYVVLIRAHYEVAKILKFDNNDFAKDVSSYPSLNELMIVSDMLISDYSSIYFDYSIQDKPMLGFAYDFNKYSSLRGMYFDIREKLYRNSENEDDLITAIKSLDAEKAIGCTRSFRSEFVEESGSASKKTVDIIWKYLNGENY